MCSVLMVHCKGKALGVSQQDQPLPSLLSPLLFLVVEPLNMQDALKEVNYGQNFWQNAMLSPGLALVNLVD